MIEDAELRESLEGQLSRYFGRLCRVTALCRNEFERQSSFLLEELEVEMDDRRRLRLIFKSQGPSALGKRGVVARLQDPYDPRCEIQTYQRVLDGRFGTARCYGADIDASSGRFWLFLEKVEGTELCDVGDISIWKDAALWLASFHSHFGSRLSRHQGFIPYDHDYYFLWMSRALEVSRQTDIDERTHTHVERLFSNYGEIIRCLLNLPITLIHGEFYPPNIIVSPTGRICPVDWGTTARGPGLVDLAALTTGRWADQRQREISRVYWKHTLPDQFSFREFSLALLHCRIHLMMQWIALASGNSFLESEIPGWIRGILKIDQKIGEIRATGGEE